MTLIEQDSGQGKTHTLVQWVLDGEKNGEFRTLIVHDSSDKDRLLKEYPKLTYQNVETFDTVRNHTYRPAQRNVKYAFDNVDMFIQRLFHEQFRGLNIDMLSARSASLYNIFGMGFDPMSTYQQINDFQLDRLPDNVLEKLYMSVKLQMKHRELSL